LCFKFESQEGKILKNQCRSLENTRDGPTCPGGFGEYTICYGLAPTPPDYKPNDPDQDLAQSSNCGEDKKGKWRKKKCKKKQEQGMCNKKRVKKRCKATCPSC